MIFCRATFLIALFLFVSLNASAKEHVYGNKEMQMISSSNDGKNSRNNNIDSYNRTGRLRGRKGIFYNKSSYSISEMGSRKNNIDSYNRTGRLHGRKGIFYKKNSSLNSGRDSRSYNINSHERTGRLRSRKGICCVK